jgi:hypothetical protein
MIRLNKKQLEELGFTIQKKPRNSYDRLESSIEIINNNGKNDKISIDDDSKFCVIYFENINLLSYNDLLRLDNRKIFKLKKAWHKRIKKLTENISLKHWDNSRGFILEFLYKPKHGLFLDADAITASLKATIDGLVHSSLLKDDNNNFVELIIPRQEKQDVSKKYSELSIVISPVDSLSKIYSENFKKIINI